jgi:hypothetical protein
MPRVPRYEQQTINNAPVAIPQATALGADAFGAGVGKGIQQVANVALDYGVEQKRKEDQKALYDFRVSIDNEESKNAYGDDESEGFLALRGDAATKHVDAYIGDFKKKIDERIASATTDEQRQAFELMGRERIARHEGQLRRHASTEFNASLDASQKALEESTLRNIGNYYNDDIRFGQELSVLRQTIIDDSDNKDQGVKVKKFRLETMTSKAYSERIDRLMQVTPIAAKQFLEDNKDLMTSDDVAKYEKAVKPLVSAQEGLDAAKEIFATAPDSGVDVLMTQMRDKFKSNPDALKHGEQWLKAMVTERKVAQEEEVKAVEGEVYGYIAKVQLAGRVPKKSDVPADVWARLAKVSPEKINQITDEMRRESEHQVDRGRAEQDRKDAKYDREEGKVTTERLTTWSMLKLNPDLLTKTNLDSLLVGGKLAKNQYQDLVTDQLAIKNDKSGQKAETIISNAAAVDVVLQSAGVSKEKKPEQYMKFHEALNNRLKTFKAESGNSPKQDDIVRLSRGLLSEVNQDGFLWDSKKRVYDADMTKVVVPKADRDAITKALKGRGRPVTEDTVKQLYVDRTVGKGGVK